MTRVVILGAGFGGLELASRLSSEFGDDADVVLIDGSDSFVFGFSKLDVLFGRKTSDEVRHYYRDLKKPGVRFVQATIEAIDPISRMVATDAGSFQAEVLVVALGASLRPEQTPGLVEGGYEFYTNDGAAAARAALNDFEGGRVLVAVTSTPYKCAPAPSEAVLLLHDELVERGLREGSEISLVLPMAKPVPPAPAASAALIARFAEVGIEFLPERIVTSVDPARKVAIVSDGEELPFDLLLAVPRHRAPDVVVAAGLTVDGWIPVNPATLETEFEGVYAVGDVTSIGTPKAGAFAEGQAAVVAERIAAQRRGKKPTATYHGTGVCFVEFGGGTLARVEVEFTPGQPPSGGIVGPTKKLVADKVEFAETRRTRWFD